MSRFILTAFILLLYGNAWAEETGCYSFDKWNESQQYFEAKGGSKFQNVDSLDSDQDGLACEELIGFKADHINPNNAKKPVLPAADQAQEKNWPEQFLSLLKKVSIRLTGF